MADQADIIATRLNYTHSDGSQRLGNGVIHGLADWCVKLPAYLQVDWRFGHPHCWVSYNTGNHGNARYWGFGRSNVFIIDAELEGLYPDYMVGISFVSAHVMLPPSGQCAWVCLNDAESEYVDLSLRPLRRFLVDGTFDFTRINEWAHAAIPHVQACFPHLNWTPEKPRVLDRSLSIAEVDWLR